MSYFYGILYRFNRLRYRGLDIDFFQLLHEKIAVLGYHDCLNRCAEHFHAIFFKCAVEVKLRSAVKCRLSAECEQYAVGALLLYHFLYEIGGDRKKINLIGNAFRGLDGRDVRID